MGLFWDTGKMLGRRVATRCWWPRKGVRNFELLEHILFCEIQANTSICVSGDDVGHIGGRWRSMAIWLWRACHIEREVKVTCGWMYHHRDTCDIYFSAKMDTLLQVKVALLRKLKQDVRVGLRGLSWLLALRCRTLSDMPWYNISESCCTKRLKNLA